MAKCYYCKDEVTNDDLTEIDGDWLRVCADCRNFIDNLGTELLDNACGDCEKVKRTKQWIRLHKEQMSKMKEAYLRMPDQTLLNPFDFD